MGGLAPGKLKSRRGWPSSPRRLLHRSNFLDPGIQELTAGKTLSTLRGWRHSHRHRFAAAWPFLVRQNGPFFHRRRHGKAKLAQFFRPDIAGKQNSRSFPVPILRESKTRAVFPSRYCGKAKLAQFSRPDIAGKQNSRSFSVPI